MKRDRSFDTEFSVYVGLDWGTAFHRACVLDSKGKILRECQVDHTGQAITAFIRAVSEIAGGKTDCVAMAIEVPRGPVVEAFLARGIGIGTIGSAAGAGIGCRVPWCRSPPGIDRRPTGGVGLWDQTQADALEESCHPGSVPA